MEFDAIVIGSGQGGNPLAHRLADLGWSVALIEREHLGGTCINTGCTPTKTMVASAQVAHYARHATRWGVETGEVSVDLAKVVARKTAIVERFRAGQQAKVENRRTLRLVRGHARFVRPRAVQVGSEVLESERIIVDTGTRPVIPDIRGLHDVRYLTNASIMELTEVPEHLLVVGGGYIGLEFGQMFRRFGSRVTVIHRGRDLLAREDPDVAAALQNALEAEGIVFALEAETVAVERVDGAVALALRTPRGEETRTGSHLLVATGRRPNTDDLGLEHAGVQTDERGFITVNSRLETSAPGVWALGDVKGGPAFTHISYDDHEIVYDALTGPATRTTDGRIVPYAVFTDPQLGRVGMTEKQARASGHPVKIGTIPMAYVARAIERDETAGLMKLVVDATDDRILGAAILSSEGGELIQVLSAVMLTGAPYTVLRRAIYIHPTLAEGFWSLMEAVKPAA
jgi:pyruvate/2-oxoglutarate dehydrogenase complex dihydrolipoamide dehydrogenase (E3) component